LTESFRYSGAGVDVAARDLPGLKADFIVRHVDDDVVLVDVGCGGGKMLRTIKDHHRRVTLLGCDVKEPTGVDRDFVFSPVDSSTGRLPYADASIDVALVFDVLEHVERPEVMLGEIKRILRPGGRLLAFVPIEGEAISWYRLYRLILGRDLYAKTKGHIQAFTHAGLNRMLTDDFVVDERRYAYHLIGQLMDATLCASLSIGSVRRVFWAHSPYHGGSDTDRSGSMLGRIVAALLRAANAVAWAESTLLRHVRTGSAGVLLVARPRSHDSAR
jgi:SAM-dependent methyltransferase